MQSKVSFISHSPNLKLCCFTLSYSTLCPLCPEQCLALRRSSINICGRHEWELLSRFPHAFPQDSNAGWGGSCSSNHPPSFILWLCVQSWVNPARFVTHHHCEQGPSCIMKYLTRLELFSFLRSCFSSCLLWDPQVSVLSPLLWILSGPLLHVVLACTRVCLQLTNVVSCIVLILLFTFLHSTLTFSTFTSCLRLLTTFSIPCWASSTFITHHSPQWCTHSLASMPPSHKSLLWTSSHCTLMKSGKTPLEIGLPGHRVHAPLTSQSIMDGLLSSCTNLHSHHTGSSFL